MVLFYEVKKKNKNRNKIILVTVTNLVESGVGFVQQVVSRVCNILCKCV